MIENNNETDTKKQWKKIASIAVGILIFVWVFAYLQISVRETLAIFVRLNPFLLVLGVLVFLTGFLPFSFRAYIYVRSIKKNVDFSTVSKIAFAASALNYITPARLEIPSKIYLLKKQYEIPFGKGAGVSIIETLTEVLVYSVMSAVWIFWIGRESYAIPVALLFVIIIAAIMIVLFGKIPTLIKKILGRISDKFTKLEKFEGDLKESGKRSIKLLPYGAVLTLVYVLANSLALQLFLKALGGDLGALNGYLGTLHLAGIFAVSTVIGVISMLPGGIGAKDASVMLLLGSFGFSHELSASVAIMSRIVYMLTLLIGGLSLRKLIFGGRDKTLNNEG